MLKINFSLHLTSQTFPLMWHFHSHISDFFPLMWHFALRGPFSHLRLFLWCDIEMSILTSQTFPLMWHCSERSILTSPTFPLMWHCSERPILTNQINVFYIKVTSCEWGHNIECYLPKVLMILVRQENPININNHPPNLTAHVINVFCCCSLPNISCLSKK